MLFTILLIILFLVLFVPTLALSVIARILSIFSFKGKKNSVHRGGGQQHGNTKYNTDNNDVGKRKGKKIFDKNEGEYVDFEEIK